jgi:hypothetical protein
MNEEMMDQEAPEEEMQPEQAAPEQAEQPENPDLMKTMLAVRKILYMDPTSDKVLGILSKTKGPPSIGLSVAATNILKVLNEATQGKIPPEIAGPLRDNLLMELAEMANASGIPVADKDIQQAKQFMSEAARQMVQGGRQQMQHQQQPQQPQRPQPSAQGGLINAAM